MIAFGNRRHKLKLNKLSNRAFPPFDLNQIARFYPKILNYFFLKEKPNA